MTRNQVERIIAVFLFVAVLIAFSYADEESKKIRKLYTTSAPVKDTRLAFKTSTLPKRLNAY